MDNFQYIEYAVDHGAAILTINRPDKKNRINRNTMEELIQGLQKGGHDVNVHSVILTAKGEYFCAGGQIDSFPDGSLIDQRKFATAFIEMNKQITRMEKPVIAAVQGHALAGGLSLVQACDLAVATRQSLFGLPELKAGLFPMLALAVMEKGLQKKRIFELIYTGKTIDAPTATEWGLINEFVEHSDKLMEQVFTYTEMIAESSPTAIRLGRAAFYSMVNMNLDSAIEYGKSALLNLLWTEDAREANRASREERKPIWSGR